MPFPLSSLHCEHVEDVIGRSGDNESRIHAPVSAYACPPDLASVRSTRHSGLIEICSKTVAQKPPSPGATTLSYTESGQRLTSFHAGNNAALGRVMDWSKGET